MNKIMYTDKLQCPYCGNAHVENLDLSDLLRQSSHGDEHICVNRHVFKCRDCKELFYYTGKLEYTHDTQY